jgi:hypothetical protein
MPITELPMLFVPTLAPHDVATLGQQLVTSLAAG